MTPGRGRARRVLLAPREIAGVAAGLQQGLESQGLEVDVLLRWPHPFGYRHRAPRSMIWRLVSRWVVEPFDAPPSRLRRLVSLAVRAVLVPLVPLRYSTVVYLGQDTLLRGGRDRRWYTRAGLRTVTLFLGSEARPPYLDGAFARGSTPEELEAVRRRTSLHRARVHQAEQDSTYVVNHPGTGQFHRRPYLDWTLLGFPSMATEPVARSMPPDGTGPPTVLHAPSDPLMKGTDRIRETMAGLADAGVPIRYVEISGRPHAEVLAAITDADLVVDQLYSDVLLPGLATEAARLGTPVLVMGYAADIVRPVAQRAGMPTRHYAHPDDLPSAVRRLVSDPSARREISGELQRCMETVWSARSVAERWGLLVQGRPDPNWLDQPDAEPYAHGCAIELGRLTGFLRRYIAAYGVDGLELEDAPRTRAAVVALAGAADGGRPASRTSAGRSVRPPGP